MNEDEQVEVLKQWWKTYGKTVIITMILSFVFIALYQYWSSAQQKKLSRSSELYNHMMEAVVSEDIARAKQEAAYLMKQYPNTIYSSLSALMLARVAVNEKDLAKASDNLSWILAHAKADVFKNIARVRQAKLLTAQGKTDEALAILADISDPIFKSVVDEARGDILLQQGKSNDAKKAYEQALSEGPVFQESQLIEMKLANISGDTA